MKGISTRVTCGRWRFTGKSHEESVWGDEMFAL